MNNDNIEVHFALSRFETALLDSLINHEQNDPLLERPEHSVRQAIENGPMSEMFTGPELHEMSPLIDRTLVTFERAGLIENESSSNVTASWDWTTASYRLSQRAHEVTETRRKYAVAGV